MFRIWLGLIWTLHELKLSGVSDQNKPVMFLSSEVLPENGYSAA